MNDEESINKHYRGGGGENTYKKNKDKLRTKKHWISNTTGDDRTYNWGRGGGEKKL